jgi:hypothetical protein
MSTQYPVSRRTALAAMGGGLGFSRIALALDHGDAAPKFRARTMDGESLTNDSVRGKVVLFQTSSEESVGIDTARGDGGGSVRVLVAGQISHSGVIRTRDGLALAWIQLLLEAHP